MALNGKVALVSGSGRGIGRALALKLAGEGARVVVNDLDEAPARATVAAVEAAGGAARACIGNVTEAGFAERYVETALSAFGGLDIIVNNAGYTWDSVIETATDEQFDAMYEVNVKAPFRILRAAAAPLIELHKQDIAAGRTVCRKVVNVSSMSGTGGNAGQISYASAKSALLGMTKTMAKEWGAYNICVNCVAFGIIATRLVQPLTAETKPITVAGQDIHVGLTPEVIEAVTRAVPLGRPGTPEDAANGIYLLCTPESDYISGQILLVGGGLTNG